MNKCHCVKCKILRCAALKTVLNYGLKLLTIVLYKNLKLIIKGLPLFILKHINLQHNLKMKVICTKCGGTDISCEAMINPNTKGCKDYTDESFLYGWCENCKTGAILSDTDEIQAEIQKKFDDFVKKNGKEPHYANCHIVWKDTNDNYDVKIQLSGDTGEDDDMFFYCQSLNGLKSLATFGCEDFIVTEVYSFELLEKI